MSKLFAQGSNHNRWKRRRGGVKQEKKIGGRRKKKKEENQQKKEEEGWDVAAKLKFDCGKAKNKAKNSTQHHV